MSASPLISISPAHLAAVDASAGGPRGATLQRAIAVARERLAALPGVRVLGATADLAAERDGVRLALDIRDTGRDGWQVACAMAGRGIAVESAGGRALVVRLRAADVEQGMQERLAPALLQALWAAPVRRGFELVLDPADRPSDRSRVDRR